MGKYITVESWPSNRSFYRYAEPGDTVDDEIAMNFMNSTDPVSFDYGFFQAGGVCYDAYDPMTNRVRPTYCTFCQKGNSDGYWDQGKAWIYLGCCFKGRTEHMPLSILECEH